MLYHSFTLLIQMDSLIMGVMPIYLLHIQCEHACGPLIATYQL